LLSHSCVSAVCWCSAVLLLVYRGMFCPAVLYSSSSSPAFVHVTRVIAGPAVLWRYTICSVPVPCASEAQHQQWYDREGRLICTLTRRFVHRLNARFALHVYGQGREWRRQLCSSSPASPHSFLIGSLGKNAGRRGDGRQRRGDLRNDWTAPLLVVSVACCLPPVSHQAR
jgi:hypothetical protein